MSNAETITATSVDPTVAGGARSSSPRSCSACRRSP
jgi:hypothetical protein